MTATDGVPFAALIREQGEIGVGVPVLLFTDATLTALPRSARSTLRGSAVSNDSLAGSLTGDPAGADAAARVVAAAAQQAGLDLDRVELFSPEAYLLQGALAATVAPDLGPSDPTPRGVAETGGRPGPLTAPWTPAHGAALLAAPVLALNFHVIPRRDRPTVRRQLEQVAAFGPSLRPGAPDSGPQVLVGFYDGFRDEGLWGAQVCAELGVRAWFFPLFDPVDGDGAAAAEEGGEPLGSVELLTADDLTQIGRVHEIGFHTASHRRAADLRPADLQREVHDPLDAISAVTGRLVTTAAWRRGTRFDPGNLADRVLRERGVSHVVSNWSVETVPPDEVTRELRPSSAAG